MRLAPAALAFAGADGEVVSEARPMGLAVMFRPGGALGAVDVETKELSPSRLATEFTCVKANPAFVSATKPPIVEVAVEAGPETIGRPFIRSLFCSDWVAPNSEDVKSGVSFEVRAAKSEGIR